MLGWHVKEVDIGVELRSDDLVTDLQRWRILSGGEWCKEGPFSFFVLCCGKLHGAENPICRIFGVLRP